MRRLLLIILWLLTDALLFSSSYVLAYFVKVGWILSSDLPFDAYLTTTLLTTPLWLIVMVSMRNYGLTRRQASARNALYIAYACMIGMAGFTLGFYFLKQTIFSRGLLLMAGILSTIAIFVWHMIFDRYQRMMLCAEPCTYPLLIIGTNRDAARLIERLQHTRSPFVPVAILDGHGAKAEEIHGVPVLGKLNKLEQTIHEKRITHLVQCDDLEQSINLLSACTQHNISYLFLPSLIGAVQKREQVTTLEGQPVIAVEKDTWWEWFFR